MQDTRIVQKGNKVLRIEAFQLRSYLKEGFDEIDENGKILTPSPVKSVPYAEVAALKEQYEKEIETLKTKLKKGAAKSE